jgi:hypothetical protein
MLSLLTMVRNRAVASATLGPWVKAQAAAGAECGFGRRAGTAGRWREGHLQQSTWARGEWTGDLPYALLHEERQTGRE